MLNPVNLLLSPCLVSFEFVKIRNESLVRDPKRKQKLFLLSTAAHHLIISKLLLLKKFVGSLILQNAEG